MYISDVLKLDGRQAIRDSANVQSVGAWWNRNSEQKGDSVFTSRVEYKGNGWTRIYYNEYLKNGQLPASSW